MYDSKSYNIPTVDFPKKSGIVLYAILPFQYPVTLTNKKRESLQLRIGIRRPLKVIRERSENIRMAYEGIM